ncbi:aminopeptidase [Marinobacter caseinilyticus]|uniref:aminopeptidase n=1 Tax=Marinobacter caseinilyticus TaxID=2692195 RepID=UPI0014097947|nr:aminopeptidase [Marinobacter caseinilyticus]
MNQLSHIYLLALLMLSQTGCTAISYYAQAINGQFSLMMEREPIDQVVARPSTSDELKRALATAVEVREFARDRLDLPVAGAFRDYVDLDRPYVVVNLVVVPEFSLQAHQWCYPFVGCQAYRGYFDLEDARAEQQTFQTRGYDTYIGGVTAYSTLGWFDDPIHSGFTRLPTHSMAALIIHELSHQVVYVAGDTAFNESFATAVELEGLKLWLTQRGEQTGFRRALALLDQRAQTLALVEDASDQLSALYQRRGEMTDQNLRSLKRATLARLREDYLALSRPWRDPGPFGENPPAFNNANLALFQQYNQYVPGFRQLLKQHDYNFTHFFEAVRALSETSAEHRSLRLSQLGEAFDEHF